MGGDPAAPPTAPPIRVTAHRLALAALLLLAAGCQEPPPTPEDRFRVASDLLAAGRVQESLAAVKALLIEQPGNGEARFLLGAAYLEANDGSAAADQFSRAGELGVPPARTLPARVRALVAAGRHQDAIDLAVDVAEGPAAGALPADARGELEYLAGRALAASGRVDAARTRFARAAGLLPDPTPAHLGLARLALTEADHAAARRYLDQARREGVDLWLLEGELALATGDRRQARYYFNEVLRLQRDDLTAHIGLARALLGQGELDAAASRLDAAAELGPEDVRVRFLRVITSLRQGELDAAFQDTLDLLSRQPDYAPALRIAGALHLLRGNLLQAEATLADYLKRYPGDVTARTLQASVHLQLREPWSALEDLAAIPAEQRRSPGILELLGTAHLASGDAGQAVEHLLQAQALQRRQAVSTGAQGLQARLGTGSMLVLAMAAAGQRDEALQVVETLAAEMGTHAMIPFLHGVTEEWSGALEAARTRYQEALTLDPAFQPALLGLAQLARRTGEFVEACRLYRQALEERGDPHLLESLANAGCDLDAEDPRLLVEGQAAAVARGVAGSGDTLAELARDEGRPSAQAAEPGTTAACGGPGEPACARPTLDAEIQTLLAELTRSLGEPAAGPRPATTSPDPVSPDPFVISSVIGEGARRVADQTWEAAPPTLAFVRPGGEETAPAGEADAAARSAAPLAYRDPATEWGSALRMAPLVPLEADAGPLPGLAKRVLDTVEGIGERVTVATFWIKAHPVLAGFGLLLAMSLAYLAERSARGPAGGRVGRTVKKLRTRHRRGSRRRSSRDRSSSRTTAGSSPGKTSRHRRHRHRHRRASRPYPVEAAPVEPSPEDAEPPPPPADAPTPDR